MKNSLNLVLIILFFIILGCSCPKMDELSKKANSTSTTSSTPSSSDTTTDSPSKGGLTLEKYGKLKNGMSYKEVVEILGGEGEETMSSGEGKYKVESYKWEGDNTLEFIIVNFTGNKMTFKTQANLK